jgi:hypothetical protein
MKSWKTSLGGVLAGLSLLLGQASTLFDTDPETNPCFTQIVAAFGMLGLGLAARDASAK